jgi:NADPH-dependent 2,4-dienoyl-CoA reductase/sulfur reductase-like enzyme
MMQTDPMSESVSESGQDTVVHQATHLREAASSACTHEVIVIGAGPAGMAAATTAARLGLRTALLDEQPHAGGQIWRDVGRADARMATLLGPDYLQGQAAVEALQASAVDVMHETLVWDVNRDLTVTGLRHGRAFQLRAPQLIAATGALERPTPIPGWTLPGVMNAGAAQIALKHARSIPQGPVVLAGAGPLLLLVACQLAEAGADVQAVIETSTPAHRLAALKHLPGVLSNGTARAALLKGLGFSERLRRMGVRRFSACRGLIVLGDDRAHGLRFHSQGRTHEIAADTVLLHHGVVPNTQLSRLMRIAHTWHPAQHAWHVVTDAYGQTSLPGLRMAGDGIAIAGALAAQAGGTLAALGAAHALGRLDAHALTREAAPFARTLEREQRIRPFLDALYQPAAEVLMPADDTIVCRCEEVTAGRVREMARLGCQGPNQTKFFSRCGMGPCQGRLCGIPVTQLLADELGRSPAEVGAYRIRAPLKPVPLSAIASMHAHAVARRTVD